MRLLLAVLLASIQVAVAHADVPPDEAAAMEVRAHRLKVAGATLITAGLTIAIGGTIGAAAYRSCCDRGNDNETGLGEGMFMAGSWTVGAVLLGVGIPLLISGYHRANDAERLRTPHLSMVPITIGHSPRGASVGLQFAF
jgi:hypothetical protein